MSIIQNMQELDVTKSSIKSAIASKGVDMINVPFTEYASKIDEINSKATLIWKNSNQSDWGNGQTVTTDLSDIDFHKDLVYFEARATSSSTTEKQLIGVRTDGTAVVCGLLDVSGGGWHKRTATFNSTGFTVSTYSNWGGPRVLNLYVIKNALS